MNSCSSASVELQLEELVKESGLEVTDHEFAPFLDQRDPLGFLRNEFFYPKMKELPGVDGNVVDGESDSIYLCGNSLGLEPKGVKQYLDVELDKWAKTGVYGHRNGTYPWALCDEFVREGMAKIVGAEKDEIVVMNGLTVNIHLMMISFYTPTPERHKVLLESRSFPSDHYAIESQIRLRGFDPTASMICMESREGENCLRKEDILSMIEKEGDSIALILFSGVQYYSGQLFDIPVITSAGQAKGCIVGWDLAHAAGNVPLRLHDWGVDWAVWCSYKYLCSGCGGLGGVFLHQKHFQTDRPRLLGWWGHKFETRFNMDNVMDLSPGPDGYRISNPPIFLVCPILASLDVFNKTNMEDLRKKSILLTGYLECLVRKFFGRDSSERTTEAYCDILTPSDPEQRGCQLSLRFSVDLHKVFEELNRRGVVCDKRLPSAIRVSPIHLYNSFQDVRRFCDMLKDSLDKAHTK